MSSFPRLPTRKATRDFDNSQKLASAPALRLPRRKASVDADESDRLSLAFASRRRSHQRDSTAATPRRPERKQSKEFQVYQDLEVDLRRRPSARRGNKKSQQKQERVQYVSMVDDNDDSSLSSHGDASSFTRDASTRSRRQSVARRLSQGFFFRVNKPGYEKQEEQPAGEPGSEMQETESVSSAHSVDLFDLQDDELQDSKQNSSGWFSSLSSSRLMSSFRASNRKKKLGGNMDTSEITLSPLKPMRSSSRRLFQGSRMMDNSSGRQQGVMDNSSRRSHAMDISELTLSPLPLRCTSHCRRGSNRATTTTKTMDSSEITLSPLNLGSEDSLGPLRCNGTCYPGRMGQPLMSDWDEEDSQEIREEEEKSPELVKKTRSTRSKLLLKATTLRFTSSATPSSSSRTTLLGSRGRHNDFACADSAHSRTEPNKRGVPRTREGVRGSLLLQRMATGSRTSLLTATTVATSSPSRDCRGVDDDRRSRLADMDVPEVRNKRKQYDSLPALPKTAVVVPPPSHKTMPPPETGKQEKKPRPMISRGLSLKLPSRRLLTRFGSTRSMSQSARTWQ